MTTIQQESNKQKIKKLIIFILKALLFLIIGIFTVYFFINSPAWVNKINQVLNKDQTAVVLQTGIDKQNTINETIIIPQANIYVPLVSVASNNRTEIENAMKQGLAYSKNINNILIAGHYSDYFWKGGDYKYILSSIGNLKPSDVIGIKHNNIFSKFEVLDMKTIKAKEFSELQNINVDLIIAADWPPSFTNYKLILEAKKIK